MTVYGDACVSVREPEDKNCDQKAVQLVRAGRAMGITQPEYFQGYLDGPADCGTQVNRGGHSFGHGHLERLSRRSTYGLQVLRLPAPEGSRISVLG